MGTIRATARRTSPRKPRQVEMRFKTWGGKRKGAGRKPAPGRKRVTHRARPALASRFPVHASLRVAKGLTNLRGKACIRAIELALVRGKRREGFRLVHYCVLKNHIHVVVEARDAVALSRGMQGLTIRVAKALNKLWGRRGRVFADRYHEEILRSPAQTRAALNYVLLNNRRHRRRQVRHPDWLDPCSSAKYFDGWRGFSFVPAWTDGSPVRPPRTWLLRVGWRRHGLLASDGVPGPTGPPRARRAAGRGSPPGPGRRS